MKTKDFIGKFNEVEVIQRMSSVKTPEEAYAVAKEYDVTDSLEEFVEEMTKFKTAIDELSEEDLEAVAGGLSPEVEITITLSLTAVSVTTLPIASVSAAVSVATNIVTAVSVSATGSALVSAISASGVAMAAASSV